MRGGIDVAVGGVNGDPERVADLADRGIPGFVVADQSGQDRETGRVGGRPAVRTPVVGAQVEECARACEPLRASSVVENVVELVEVLVRAVDDDQMPVFLAALIDIPRRAAFDPVRFTDRLRWNWIERHTLAGGVVDAIALVPILEGHRLPGLVAVDDRVRHAVDVHAARGHFSTEVRMQMARAAIVDESDVARGIAVDRRRGDVGVPPVVCGKERQQARRRRAFDRDTRWTLTESVPDEQDEHKGERDGCEKRAHGGSFPGPSGVRPSRLEHYDVVIIRQGAAEVQECRIGREDLFHG